ncbi:MAG: GTPase domain-containing protein [Candidatus Mucispirillum faecigallinarum]|nr:GTPase domain-containing protein [Candidatus Mucispirillum faecigallinarum]
MFVKRDIDEFKQQYLKTSFKPNVLICGDSGVGKSTLINDLLGKKLAPVSAAKACTKDFECYSDNSINIYDSKGRERDINIEEFLSIVVEFIKKRNNSNDPREHIHVFLYCISEARVFNTMGWFIDSLKKCDVSPIVCITKADTKTKEQLDDIRNELNNLNVHQDDIIYISSPTKKHYIRQDESIKQGHAMLMNRIFSASKSAYETAVSNAEKINHYKKVDGLNDILKKLLKNS